MFIVLACNLRRQFFIFIYLYVELVCLILLPEPHLISIIDLPCIYAYVCIVLILSSEKVKIFAQLKKIAVCT